MTAKEINQAEKILTSQLQMIEGLDVARDVAFYQKIDIIKTYQNAYNELSGMINFLGKMGYDCTYHPKGEDHESYYTISKGFCLV